MKTKLHLESLERRDVPTPFPPFVPQQPYESAALADADARGIAEARVNRDGHIGVVVNANPTWTQGQKDAINAAVTELAHAADTMPWNGDVGVIGNCNEWVDKFQKDNFELIQKLEKDKLVKSIRLAGITII